MPTPPTNTFYAFPNGGFGVKGPLECSGQKMVDVSQNVITYARSSVATCVRESDGLGIELVANEPIVMRVPTASTHYGPLIESGSKNWLVRSYRLDQVAAGEWVNTATVTADAWSGPFSSYRTTSGFEQLSDVSAVASTGSCQVLTSATQTKYAFSVTLRSGTLTTARLTISGTGNAAGDRTCAISGLDSTLSRDDRKGCVSPAAYGVGITAVTVCILPGAVDGDTGTIGAVDAQLEQLGHITSYIPTTTTAGSRLVATATVPTSPATLTLSNTAGCVGTESYNFRYDAEAFWSQISWNIGGARGPYFPDTTTLRVLDSTNTAEKTITTLWNRHVQGTAEWTGSTLTAWELDAGTGTGTYDGTMFGTTITADTGNMEGVDGLQDAILSNVILDVTASPCRTQATMANITRAGWVGDSLSANVPVTEKIPEGFFRRASINGTNFAHGGDDFTLIAAQWAASGNGTYDTVVLWGGVNDIILDGTTGAALYATELAWVKERARRGVHVYWLDITPFKGYVGSDATKVTYRNDFNTAQAAYCVSPDTNVKCVTVSQLVWNPADHDALLAACSSDLLHFTNQDCGNLISARVAALYP